MMHEAEVGLELEIVADSQAGIAQNGTDIMRRSPKDSFTAKGSNVRSVLRLPETEEQLRLVSKDEVSARLQESTNVSDETRQLWNMLYRSARLDDVKR